MGDKNSRGRWDGLPPFTKNGALNVVIETPRGSRNKFKFDPDSGVFRLHKVLPAGMMFPFDFGYVPGTLAQDGDPLDVLVLLDEPVFCGCVVTARPIGILEAEQTDPGDPKKERNDRLIAVAANAPDQEVQRSLSDLPEVLLDQIGRFFAFYHQQEGGSFEPIGQRGPKKAIAMVEQAIRTAHKRNKNGKKRG